MNYKNKKPWTPHLFLSQCLINLNVYHNCIETKLYDMEEVYHFSPISSHFLYLIRWQFQSYLSLQMTEHHTNIWHHHPWYFFWQLHQKSGKWLCPCVISDQVLWILPPYLPHDLCHHTLVTVVRSDYISQLS